MPINKIRRLFKISFFKFVWYNFFSKKIERHGKGFLIPFHHSLFDLGKGSKIILHDGNFWVNDNLPKHSKQEAYVIMGERAILEIDGRTCLCFGGILTIKSGAKVCIGSSVINSFTRITAAKNITIGQDVLIAGNVTILDYDFHDILDDKGVPINSPRPVVISNHVWITSKCTILKGSKIGDGAVISANSVVAGKIRGGCMAVGNPARPVLEVDWRA